LVIDLFIFFEKKKNQKVNVGNLDIEKNDDLILLLQMLIKCADVSNPGKKFFFFFFEFYLFLFSFFLIFF